ncbi:MAG TPA: ABC transporter permease [Gemmatimonadaceae bacterium]|nr:ABC transporter permease [Gemmatimonadaceae bacterium]
MSERFLRGRFLRLPWRSSTRRRADLEDELRFYFDMRTRELVEQGMPESDARREAVREFGDLEYTKRYCLAEDAMSTHEERRTDLLAELRQDVAHSWRTLRRSPGFAVVALITLALGIGANTAIFSVVNGLLLRDLPYREAAGLVRIWGAHTDSKQERSQLSAADFVDLKARQRSFATLGAFAWSSGTYVGTGDPVQLAGLRVDASVLNALGVRPTLGRTFAVGEDSSGANPTIVLAHSVWRRLLGSDSAIVGKSITLGGRSRTVIGVLPPTFFFPTMAEAEYYLPLDLTGILRDVNRARKFHNLGAIGRLRPAATVTQGRAELTSIMRQLEREYPDANTNMSVSVLGVREAVVGDTRPALLILLGASLLVLLIACANVAGMLLSRAVSRRQELAVRAALGAGRARLVRQMLTESLVLAVVGGGVGLLLAVMGTRALIASAGDRLPAANQVAVDGTVLLTALLVTIASGVVFGLIPALAASRGMSVALKDATRGSSSGVGRHRLRTALVAGQLALAVVLLVGAGLLVRSLMRLQQNDLGYSVDSVLTFEVSLGGQRYETVEAQDQFFDALYSRLAALPGVTAVGGSGNIPLRGGSMASLAIDGRPQPEGKLPEIGYQPVSDDLFKAMGVPLKRGRPFNTTDRNDSPRVVILSEGLARVFWPNADPIGARVRLGPNPSVPWLTVVGVVGDVRMGVSGDPRPTAYVSSRQDHWGGAAVVVRTSGDPMSLLPAVRREVKALDATLPVGSPASMKDVRSEQLADRRLPMQLMMAFALLALTLAAVGVYGVMAYSVAARTREIGVRVALGAQPSSVFAMVVRQGLGAAVVGLAIGLAGAAALGKLLTKLLYGVGATDALTFVGVAGVLLAVTLGACLIPARRALRVNPLEALRSE